MPRPLVYPAVVRGRARSNFDALQSRNIPIDRVVHVLLEQGWTEHIVTTLQSGEYVKWPIILRILQPQKTILSLITLGTLEKVTAYASIAVLRSDTGTIVQPGKEAPFL